jgi:hypothetical protein
MIDTALIERARDTRIEDELSRRGIKLRGRVDRCGPCPRCGGVDRFSIHVKNQLFNCRQCGGKGRGSIDLVMFLDDCNFSDAIAHLAGAAPQRTDFSIAKKPPPATKQHNEEADRERSINAARLIWARRRPIAGTIADHYFRFRGLTIGEDLAHCIGFDPEASWREAANDPASPLLHVPCVLAAFRLIDTDEIVAVQKTRLNPDGGKFGRRFNGPSAGAVCKIDSDEAVTQGLSLAEGLETALSARVLGFLPCWATGGTGTLETFPVLPGIEGLTLHRERDANGASARAVEACARRWYAAERDVKITDTVSAEDKDLNDVLQNRLARA